MWKDKWGRTKTFGLVYKVSSKWQEFGVRLGQDPKRFQGWSKKHRSNAIKIWKEVMEMWLAEDGTHDYPATWEGVHSLLCDLNLAPIAAELRHALSKQS